MPPGRSETQLTLFDNDLMDDEQVPSASDIGRWVGMRKERPGRWRKEVSATKVRLIDNGNIKPSIID